MLICKCWRWWIKREPFLLTVHPPCVIAVARQAPSSCAFVCVYMCVRLCDFKGVWSCVRAGVYFITPIKFSVRLRKHTIQVLTSRTQVILWVSSVKVIKMYTSINHTRKEKMYLRGLECDRTPIHMYKRSYIHPHTHTNTHAELWHTYWHRNARSGRRQIRGSDGKYLQVNKSTSRQ